MGNHCSCTCGEEVTEVNCDAAKTTQQSQRAHQEAKVELKINTRQVREVKTSMKSPKRYFTGHRTLEELEKKSQLDGLEFRFELSLDNGAKYTGYVKPEGNVKHGPGEQFWEDGAHYEGLWSDNRANGEGKFWHADGDIYEGHWVNDKTSGYGVYYHMNGAKYDGYWLNDL